jgi:hypothetical protein
MMRMIVVVACSLAVLIGSPAAKQITNDQYAELQKNFAEAYKRKDADAMLQHLPRWHQSHAERDIPRP